MQFETRLLETAGYLSHRCGVGSDAAICIALEGNYKDPSSYGGEIHRILAALDITALLRSPTPIDLALEELGSIIRADVPRLWGGLIFAGVHLTKSIVTAATAGDLRVHVRSGAEVRVTKEHNLLNATETEAYDGLASMSEAFRAEVVTRALGSSKPPDIVTWSVDVPYQVVLCSSRVHGCREPGAYLSHPKPANVNTINGLHVEINAAA